MPNPKQKTSRLRRTGKAFRAFWDTTLFHHGVRIGKHGKPLIITKLRTMRKDAQRAFSETELGDEIITQKHGKSESDVRTTRLGRILRRYHIDELPQLFNIFRKEMNWVGVRPLRRSQYQKLPADVKVLYDELGPGLAGLHYACKNFPPSVEEVYATLREFHALWKKSPAKAQRIFGLRILKNKLSGKAPGN